MSLQYRKGAKIQHAKRCFYYKVNDSKLSSAENYERQLNLTLQRLSERKEVREPNNVVIELSCENGYDFLNSKHTLKITYNLELGPQLLIEKLNEK